MVSLYSLSLSCILWLFVHIPINFTDICLFNIEIDRQSNNVYNSRSILYNRSLKTYLIGLKSIVKEQDNVFFFRKKQRRERNKKYIRKFKINNTDLSYFSNMY